MSGGWWGSCHGTVRCVTVSVEHSSPQVFRPIGATNDSVAKLRGEQKTAWSVTLRRDNISSSRAAAGCSRRRFTG